MSWNSADLETLSGWEVFLFEGNYPELGWNLPGLDLVSSGCWHPTPPQLAGLVRKVIVSGADLCWLRSLDWSRAKRGPLWAPPQVGLEGYDRDPPASPRCCLRPSSPQTAGATWA